jgi:hypothetical protein
MLPSARCGFLVLAKSFNFAAICGSLHYYDTIRNVQMARATMLASQLEQIGYVKC